MTEHEIFVATIAIIASNLFGVLVLLAAKGIGAIPRRRQRRHIERLEAMFESLHNRMSYIEDLHEKEIPEGEHGFN